MNRKGFTLIELLLVIAILTILAGIIVLSVSGVFTRSGERAYELARNELQIAVSEYMIDVNAPAPVMVGTNDLNACLLLGILRELPDSVGVANGNCSTSTSHYVWTFNDGNVKSLCDDCPNGAGDGYMGIFP